MLITTEFNEKYEIFKNPSSEKDVGRDFFLDNYFFFKASLQEGLSIFKEIESLEHMKKEGTYYKFLSEFQEWEEFMRSFLQDIEQIIITIETKNTEKS